MFTRRSANCVCSSALSILFCCLLHQTVTEELDMDCSPIPCPLNTQPLWLLNETNYYSYLDMKIFPDYEDDPAWKGLLGSSTYLQLQGKERYNIRREGQPFIVRFMSISTVFAKYVKFEIYKSKKKQKRDVFYWIKFQPEFTSEWSSFSFSTPEYLNVWTSKILVKFTRTLAGDNSFRIKDFFACLCIPNDDYGDDLVYYDIY